MVLIQLMRVFGRDLFPKQHSNYFIPSLVFPGHRFHLLRDEQIIFSLQHEPNFSIHITIFSSRGLLPTQERKKNSLSNKKKTRTGSFFVHTPETQSTLCGCLRFSSFLSHTAHKTALDTSAARKRGYLPFTNNPDQINFHDRPTRMIRDTVQILDVAAPKEPPESAAAHRKRASVSSFQQIAMRRRRCGCWLQ